MLEAVKLKLEGFGYEVITAGDGCEGFKCAHTENPDIIILDVFLSRMDGYELCSLMRADTKLSGIPIILFTCLSRKEDVEQGLAAGADVCITKPFDDMALVRSIEDLL